MYRNEMNLKPNFELSMIVLRINFNETSKEQLET